MKLYDVPRNTSVRVMEDVNVPIGAPVIKKGDVIRFHRLDGMYSHCHNDKGEEVYLAAYAEVEIVDTI